jgi:hypothetical protein
VEQLREKQQLTSVVREVRMEWNVFGLVPFQSIDQIDKLAPPA